MTTSPEGGLIPELTQGWRLRMARELTGMGLREFAEEIGVSPDTLTSAEHDRRRVRRITINAYALRSGVNKEWLETGKGSPTTPPPGDGLPTEGTELAKLTESKRRRARGTTTRRYLVPACTAA